jgi:hypothetical protein
MKVYNIDFLYCNDLNTLLFPPNILNLRKTVTNVVVIVIESEEPYVVIFFWRKKVRNANGEGSSWKSAANKTHM